MGEVRAGQVWHESVQCNVNFRQRVCVLQPTKWTCSGSETWCHVEEVPLASSVTSSSSRWDRYFTARDSRIVRFTWVFFFLLLTGQIPCEANMYDDGSIRQCPICVLLTTLSQWPSNPLKKHEWNLTATPVGLRRADHRPAGHNRSQLYPSRDLDLASSHIQTTTQYLRVPSFPIASSSPSFLCIYKSVLTSSKTDSSSSSPTHHFLRQIQGLCEMFVFVLHSNSGPCYVSIGQAHRQWGPSPSARLGSCRVQRRQGSPPYFGVMSLTLIIDLTASSIVWDAMNVSSIFLSSSTIRFLIVAHF